MKQVFSVEEGVACFPEGHEVNGKEIRLYISHEEITALLLNYNPDDFNSPDIVTCRALARLILDALNS